MSLRVSAGIRERGVDFDLEVTTGEVVAILGPNGAGKSSLLSMISGALRPDTGQIVLDGRALVDVERDLWVPAYRRGVVMLAQQALLFPHLSAVANVAFGPRSRGIGRKPAQELAMKWLADVDAAEFADRRPAQLSGGQAQRIAIARALAADPALLLLDEPMAALDVEVAPALRQLLRKVLRDNGRTALLVTHDLIDALALADRVVVIENGRIVENGVAKTVLSQPRSSFAAKIAGINLISGTVEGHGIISAPGQRVQGVLDPGCVERQLGVAVFRPSAVSIHLALPTGSPRNHLPAIITDLEPQSDLVRVGAMVTGSELALHATVTAEAVADLDLAPGKAVYYAVKATEVTIFPAAGESARVN